MLTYYASNRLETLSERLCATIARPRVGNPFEPDVVVVQTIGVGRWLTLEIARRNGICANVTFPFPLKVIERLCGSSFEGAWFSRDELTWRLMKLLPNLSRTEGFEPVARYLASDDGFRLYELARRLADSFDQYLTYRPDWIESGVLREPGNWQSVLWKHLATDAKLPHRIEVLRELENGLSRELVTQRLPERIALFGVGTLPPLYLDIFCKLGDWIDVDIFCLDPCREYWGDIVSERDIARRTRFDERKQFYFESGNKLLSSFGKLGRDFMDALQEKPHELEALFVEPDSATLLGAIQSDILALKTRGMPDHPRTPVASYDTSIQLHSCHTPMREIEVLHDRLLTVLEANPVLKPPDIIVMTPNIELYAPLIDAVFSTADGNRFLPYSIADRPLRVERPVIQAFLSLLETLSGRFTSRGVLDLLTEAPVRERFRLSLDDIETVTAWTRDAGIRWGIDETFKTGLDLPATRENTWAGGLDRLLLGYACSGQASIFNITPLEAAEGTEAETLGRLVRFCRSLFEAAASIRSDKMISDWVELIRPLISRFCIATNETAADLLRIAEACDAIGATAATAGFDRAVGFDFVRAELARHFEENGSGGRFLSGGVTFCGLVPLRSIPAPVVCLIGMNDGAFPRADSRPEFDLLRTDYRRGDRSRRADDRYLFLEALLAARRQLLISYVGQDVRDDTNIPPSVLVSELLDCINGGFGSPDVGSGNDRAVSTRLIVRHPLQPFSRRYFEADSPIRSYSDEYCSASIAAAATRAAATPFFNGKLDEPGDEWRTVEIAQLIDFYSNPTRYLLRRRLGLFLDDRELGLAEAEPFEMEHFDFENLQHRLVLDPAFLESEAATQPFLGEGILPHGSHGRIILAGARQTASVFKNSLPPAWPRESHPIDLRLGRFRLVGQVQNATSTQSLGLRVGRLQMRDRLAVWLRHLALSATVASPELLLSRFYSTNVILSIGPIANSRDRLDELLNFYWRGLTEPLRFFPKSAYAYATAVTKGKYDAALPAACGCWETKSYFNAPPGESQNPYYAFAFGGDDPFDAEFRSLAIAIWRPALDATADIEPGVE